MIRLIFSVYLRRLRQDEISTYAAQIAFFSILSIVPFLMLLSMWLSNLGTLNWEGLLVVLEESGTLPPSGLKMLRQILSSLNGSVGLFSLSALMVFWSSSRMIRALMTGMHMVYRERDKRSLLLRYLLSILYTILLSIAIVLMLVMSIFGRKILELLGSSPFLELVWGVLRLVVPVLVLLLIFWSLFLVLPTQRVSLLDALPGAVFSTITLLVVSQIFSFYVNLRDTSFLYGGLSGFVAILFWFYQFGYILMLGMELNAVLFCLPEYHAHRQHRRELRRRRRSSAKKTHLNS